MDAVIDIAQKVGNLGGLAVFAYFVLAELREQRREARRARSEDREALERLTMSHAAAGFALVAWQVFLELQAEQQSAAPRALPRAITGPVQPSRPRRHAPPFGVPLDETTKPERPSRRMRSVSDELERDHDDE